MIARIGKTYSFEAAHRLPNHDGKCARLHGHSYTATIEVEGEIAALGTGNSSEGMVLDYGVIDQAWEVVVVDLDHRDLNETIGPAIGPTTAEQIALWILRAVRALGLPATAVTVRETAKTFARVDYTKQEELSL